jgi:hypothetical protein
MVELETFFLEKKIVNTQFATVLISEKAWRNATPLFLEVAMPELVMVESVSRRRALTRMARKGNH